MASTWADAADTVTVKTASGRQFTAQVDNASTAARLWLRADRPGIRMLRPLDWDQVVQVRAGEQLMTGAEFRALIEAKRWPVASDPFVDTSDTPPQPNPRPTAPRENRDQASDARPDLPIGPAPVRGVHLDAYVANWDAGVEVDGVVVHVYPLDMFGGLAAISGTIEVELIGQDQTATRTRGEPFPQLGRWVQPMAPADFGPDGAVFLLPFQALHPEFDVELARLAVVHGRLTVPGDGVFDDTVGMVPIRPYSAPRDRLQQLRGTRFFSNEVTTRGQRVNLPSP